MSVLKIHRSESKAEYINTANEIFAETMQFLTRLSARYSRLLSPDVMRLASEVLDNAEKASVGNAIEDISACPDMDFTGNTFRKYEGVCIDIKSTDNVEIKENSFLEGKYLKTENCSAVKDM